MCNYINSFLINKSKINNSRAPLLASAQDAIENIRSQFEEFDLENISGDSEAEQHEIPLAAAFSQPGSQQGSRPGSLPGSRPGSRPGSLPGSRQGSHPGSRQGSRPASLVRTVTQAQPHIISSGISFEKPARASAADVWTFIDRGDENECKLCKYVC